MSRRFAFLLLSRRASLIATNEPPDRLGHEQRANRAPRRLLVVILIADGSKQRFDAHRCDTRITSLQRVCGLLSQA